MPTVSTPRRLYQAALRRFLARTFRVWERLGFHVTPVHYYQPLPKLNDLTADVLSRHSALAGIDLREDAQLALLEQIRANYSAEYRDLPIVRQNAGPDGFHVDNPAFKSVDVEILYGLVRAQRPSRVIEIGAGYSTLVVRRALEKNAREGSPGHLRSIDPYPNPRLDLSAATELIRRPIQEMELTLFDELAANDILFIDSTHVVKAGGDVQYEFLEILPRLRPGVIVHIHDIFLPAEYPAEWFHRFRYFWTEQYLLQAFLAFNRAFEVVWLGSYMHLQNPDRLKEAFPSYGPGVHPASCWIRRLPEDD